MILEEVRKDKIDKKGKRHNKLVCVALSKEDSIAIAIKNRDFPEDVEVDIFNLLKLYADEDEINYMRLVFKSIHEKLKAVSL